MTRIPSYHTHPYMYISYIQKHLKVHLENMIPNDASSVHAPSNASEM